MGVSYDISRREQILGGPEKPISELGRKGYKRFWAGEIARWLLELDARRAGEEEDGGGGGGGEEGETLVTVDHCSRATWIAPDDCLAVLREMGVVVDAGLGPPETPTATASATTHHNHNQQHHPKRSRSRSRGHSAAADEPADELGEVSAVPRVRLDKDAVRRWVAAHGVELSRACDPHGFVEGYAVRQGGEGDEELDGE